MSHAESESTLHPRLVALLDDLAAGGLAAVLFDDPVRIKGLLDADGRIVRANACAGRWLGIDPAQLRGTPIYETPGFSGIGGPLPADERAEAWQRRIERLLAGDESAASYEIELDPPGGQRVVLRVRLMAVREGNDVAGFLLTGDDIGAERAAAEAARNGERLFRALVESLPQMVWMSSEGRGMYFAPSWERFLGVPVQQLLDDGWSAFIHPDDREQLAASWQIDRLLSEPPPRMFRMRRADGEYRWMEAQLRQVDDGAGGPKRTIGATLDVTDRYREAERVREQREQLRGLLRLSRMGSYAWYLREDRFEADARCAEILGFTAEELADPATIHTLIDRVHPDDRAVVSERLARAGDAFDGRFENEYRVLLPGRGNEERVRWVVSIGRVEFDEHGPVRMVGVLSDVTERKEEEDARMRLQRVEAMGTLAGGIAHDLRNVAGAILSYARVAQAELAAGASPAESLDEIARGALHAGEIVERLLSFGRSDGHRRLPLDVGGVAREVESLLRPALPGRARLVLAVADELPQVVGDATQLHQALVNLVTNAAHAMGAADGEIRIAVEPAPASVLPGSATAGVRIRVDDDGPGIAESAFKRLWEPFFTTKPAGEGTGLGLPVVQHIVHSHHGTIAAVNRPEGGARFEIVLPAARPPAGDPAQGLPAVRGTVMFVDDEAALVRAAQRAMPYRGFEVAGFTDPREALNAFRESPDAYDVLITDLSMPGLTGLQLIAQIRRVRPELPVVLTSGFIGPRDIEGHDVDAVMPKPVSIDDLGAAAGRLLDR